MSGESHAVDAYVLTMYRREGLSRDEHVPDLEVYVTRKLPPECDPEVYRADAEALARHLWYALPGGTVDRLIVELMERRASLFRVGFLSADELRAVAAARRGELPSGRELAG